MKLSELHVLIQGDTKGLDKALDHAEKHTKDTAFVMSDEMMKVTSKMAMAGAGLTAAITVPFLAAANQAAKMASDMAESASKTNQVFGASAKVIQDFAKTSADSLGVTKKAAMDAASSYGLILQASGLVEKQSAVMSLSLTKLSADLASFFNVGIQEAMTSLKAGLVGESEPLRRFGVLLSEAAVEAKAVAMGIWEVGDKLTEGQKVQARYALILEQTKKASGDFTRTSQGLANQERITQAQFEEAATSLGAKVLPIKLQLVKTVSAMVKTFTELPEPVRNGMLGIAAIAAAAGPAALGLSAVARAGMSVVTMSTALNAALITLAGKSGAMIGMSSAATMVAGAMAAITSPVGIVIASVTALTGVLWLSKKAWDAQVNAGILTTEQINATHAATGRLIAKQYEEANALKKLGAEYDALYQKKNRTVQETQRLNELFDQIARINPTLVKGYNQQGEALHGLIGQQDQFTAAILRTAEAQRQFNFADTFRPQVESMSQELISARERLNFLIKSGVRVLAGSTQATERKMVDDGTGKLVPRDVPIPGSSVPRYENRLSGPEYTKAVAEARAEVSRLEQGMQNLKSTMTQASRESKGLVAAAGKAGKEISNVMEKSLPNAWNKGAVSGEVRPMNPFGDGLAVKEVSKQVEAIVSPTLEAFRRMREGVYNTWREMNALNPIDLLKIQFPGVPEEEIRKLDLFTQKIAEWNRQKENAKYILREMLAGTGDSILSPSQMRSIAILANPVLAMVPKIKEMATAFNDERNKRFRDTMRDIALQVQILGTNSQDAKLKIKLLSEGMTEAQAMAVVQAERQRTEMERYQEMLKGIVNTATSGIQESLDQLLRGRLPSALKAIRNMFSQIFAQIAQDFIRSQLNTIVLNALGGVRTGGRSGGGFLGGLGGVSGAMSSLAGMAAIAGSAASGAWSGGASLAAFADGGYMRPGQLSIVGERGPEIMVSGRGGTVIPNEALGGQTINVHITVYANDAASFSKTKEQIASEVGAAISKAAARGS